MKSMGRMERIVIIISILVIVTGISYGAVKTILQLTEETAPTSDDLVHVWEVTGGNSRKVTLANLVAGLGITATVSEINTPLDGALVTLTEFRELETIGATTISANQWAALGGITETLTAAELNILDGVLGVTAAELSYIGDVTSLIQAQLDLLAPLANPTFTGVITIGSAGISEAELEILDGALLSTTQLNYLQNATGTTGTDTSSLVFSISPQLTTPDIGAATATSLTLDAAATPAWVFRDSGNPGTDKEIAKFDANFLSGADGAEDGAWYLRAMLGGSEIVSLEWNSDNEQVTMGDSGTGEDLIFDFEEATDNEVGVSTNSGVTRLNFNAISLITTGNIVGAVNIVTTTDGSESPTAEQMYGSFFVADNATAANDTDYTLPTAVAGMSGCFYDNGAGTGGIIIDASASDEILLNGTGVGVADAIDSPGVAGDGANGDFICLLAIDATSWVTLGRSGTWVDGGAD